MYSNKKLVTGNLCNSLCNSKNEFRFLEDYKLVGCYRNGIEENQGYQDRYAEVEFKTVLVYELVTKSGKSNKASKIVLKSRHKSFYDFDTHIDYDFKEKSIYEQLKFLITLIQTTIQSNFGVKVNNDMIDWLAGYLKNETQKYDNSMKDIFYYVKLLGTHNFEYFEKALKSNNKQQMAVFITNLAVLINQEEYLFYRYFQTKRNTLDVLGTCGNFYAVEFAESLSTSVGQMNNNERKSLALKFLDMIASLDSDYLADSVPKTKMQLCDVKLDNFGLGQGGELRIIDTDMLHPDSYMFTTKYCDRHDDCHFFDCKSYCESNHCLLKRINNNLQTLCEKIFSNPYIQTDALFSNIQLDKDNEQKLKSILKQCTLPGTYKRSDVPIEADQKLIEEFKTILTKN